MAYVNFSTREILVKIVYYGPGLGGKTTSLQYIYNSLPQTHRGKMISLATDEDRTIYFDFLPVYLGKLQGFTVRLQLYTVPGQVRYNQTRRLVLKGVDGIVFVADLQKHRKFSNIESMQNCEDNLHYYGLKLEEIPHVIQYNKIDLPNILSPEELDPLLNRYHVPWFRTCAVTGEGVLDALTTISKMVFDQLKKRGLKSMATTTASTEEPAEEILPEAEVEEEMETVIEIEEDDEEAIEVTPNDEDVLVEEAEITDSDEEDDIALIEPETGESIPLSQLEDLETPGDATAAALESERDLRTTPGENEPGLEEIPDLKEPERTEWETRELTDEEFQTIQQPGESESPLEGTDLTVDETAFDALDRDFNAEDLDIQVVDTDDAALESETPELAEDLSRTVPAGDIARAPTPERPAPFEDEIQRSVEAQLRSKLGSVARSSTPSTSAAPAPTLTVTGPWPEPFTDSSIEQPWHQALVARSQKDLPAFQTALTELIRAIEARWNKPLETLLPEAIKSSWQIIHRHIHEARAWSETMDLFSWFALWSLAWFHWQDYVERHIL